MTRASAVLTFALVMLSVTVLAASKASAGATPLGDVNCNNRTDAVDSSLILQRDARLLDSLPCESAGDVNRSATLDAVDSTIVLQFIARLFPALPALLRLDVETPRPINVGDEFVVSVRIDDAYQLAAFGFRLQYDHGAMTYLGTDDLGAIFLSGDRPSICGDPADHHDESIWDCVTLGAPRCLGGPAGPSGNGVLARLTFRADRAGTTAFALADTDLVWDDLQPCDPEIGAIPLPHDVQNTSVEIAP